MTRNTKKNTYSNCYISLQNTRHNSEDGFYILINKTRNNRLPFHNICHVNKQNDVNNDAANVKYFHHV